MGQYYQAYIRYEDGTEKKFDPHTAIYMTRNGLTEVEDDIPWGSFEDPDSFHSCMSGLKLTEHSWIGNNLLNGVMEAIKDKPARVAWVGDYANKYEDYNDLYTVETYKKVWADEGMKDQPFDRIPEQHKDGYIVNLNKSEYIDLAKYIEKNNVADWGALHPLSLMTAIGNGRGGGDYRGYNDRLVGTWAMDMIVYTDDAPVCFDEVLPLFDPMA